MIEMAKLKSKQVGDIAIVYPTAEYTGGDETEQLDEALREPIKGGTSKLIVNLEHTTLINSLGIGTLISAYAHYARQGGRLVLSNVDERIRMTLAITKLVKVFDVYDSEEAALESLRNWKPSDSPAAHDWSK